MADLGEYFGSMFLGNSGSDSGAKKGADELWKVYQQAAKIKPIWDGKKWVIPPGAIQRFQMLLPLLQAQAAAGRAGSQAQGNDKGVLGKWLGEAGGGIGKALVDKMGGGKGFSGMLDKVMGLFEGPGYQPTGEYDLSKGSVADFLREDAQPSGEWDSGKFTEAPAESIDLTGTGGASADLAAFDQFQNGSLDDLIAGFDIPDVSAADMADYW